MMWPAGRRGTTIILGDAARGSSLGFGTSSMSGKSENRLRHVRLSPFFWPQKEERHAGAVNVTQLAEAPTLFQAPFSFFFIPSVSCGPCKGRGCGSDAPALGAMPEPGLSDPLSLFPAILCPCRLDGLRRGVLCRELNCVTAAPPPSISCPSSLLLGAAFSPPFRLSRVLFCAQLALFCRRPSLSSSRRFSSSSRLLAFLRRSRFLCFDLFSVFLFRKQEAPGRSNGFKSPDGTIPRASRCQWCRPTQHRTSGCLVRWGAYR